MDSMRSLNTSLPGSATQKPQQPGNQSDSPEQLLDAFKAAALSVTKLYKTSAASQSKARIDGYQDCLDDLLTFLDKKNIGIDDGEGWRIRQWATERLDSRESPSHTAESEDEADKTETASSPELTRTASGTQPTSVRAASCGDVHNGHQMRTDAAPTPQAAPAPAPVTTATATAPTSPPITHVVVPSQDSFTFQSAHPWPPAPAPPQQQDAYMNLANLDLSDGRTHDSAASGNALNPTSVAASGTSHRSGRSRPSRLGARQGNQLGRGAGSKRKLNFAEIFDLGSLGNDKNMFGGGGSGGGKRSRHT